MEKPHRRSKILVQNEVLASYRDDLSHALANQRARRREILYRQPSWEETLRTLSNGTPANVADLQALVLDQLADIRNHIANSNTDIFKRFWNEDHHRRIVDPKAEESCRNVLVDLLRERLRYLKIHVEPEGHMARDRRVDIAVFSNGMKMVIELKRHYHAQVWNAAEAQLDRFYTRDPQSQGFGIYGIFWFGMRGHPHMPSPPNSRTPSTAAEMEKALKSCIPMEKRERIAVVVIDVSGQ